ncbi:MAG: hypothetical protein FWD49_06520 [Firmicutes bacterium]|nr:hypothetical protein [Bacillota bacterium]
MDRLAEVADLINQAEEGNSTACFELGNVLHDCGDPQSAIEYYRKGISIDNNIDCTCALAEAYYEGDGVEQDSEKADSLYEGIMDRLTLLASENDESALLGLAFFYQNSPKYFDLDKAYGYFAQCFEITKNPVAGQMMIDIEEFKQLKNQNPTKPPNVKKRRDYRGLKAVFKVIGICIAIPLIALFYIGKFFVTILLAFLGGGSSGYSSPSGSGSYSSQDSGSGYKSMGKGKLVQEGMHRYIETSSGKRISIMDYDTYSGTAKDYDGNSYKIEGGGIEYR